MRKSVLEQLFNGEVYPAEQAKSKDERYREAVAGFGENRESLYATFTADQLVIFGKFSEYYYMLADMEHTAFFEEGFKLGAKIIMEVMQDSNIPIEGISVLLKTSGGKSNDN